MVRYHAFCTGALRTLGVPTSALETPQHLTEHIPERLRERAGKRNQFSLSNAATPQMGGGTGYSRERPGRAPVRPKITRYRFLNRTPRSRIDRDVASFKRPRPHRCIHTSPIRRDQPTLSPRSGLYGGTTEDELDLQRDRSSAARHESVRGRTLPRAVSLEGPEMDSGIQISRGRTVARVHKHNVNGQLSHL